MTREYWRLDIEKEGGTRITIFGTEETLRTAYQELKTAKALPDGVAAKLVEIHGHTDTADRAEVAMFVEVEKVHSATLVRMV